MNTRLLLLPWKRQRGLTLVELMVALILSLMLMGGMITVFLANRTTYNTQQGVAQVQENGRMALTLLTADLRNAGYRGCNTRGTTLINVVNDTTDYVWDLDNRVDGFEATGSNAWTPTLSSAISGKSPAPDGAALSDVLTVRFSDGESARVSAHADKTADLTLTAQGGIQTGDVLAVGDCQNAAVFQVTGVNGTTVQHGGVDLGRAFPGGDLSRLTSRTYYVATGTYAGARPALWRVENNGSAEELIQGIDNLQVLYGEDDNGDSRVDDYVEADDVGDWASVLAVRLNVLSSSIDDTAVEGSQTYTFNGNSVTASDGRLRQEFSATVTLRNLVP